MFKLENKNYLLLLEHNFFKKFSLFNKSRREYPCVIIFVVLAIVVMSTTTIPAPASA